MSINYREPRKTSDTRLRHEANGTPYFEKTIHTKNYDFETHRWVMDKSKDEIVKLTPEQKGLKKQCEGALLLKRSAFDEKTFKQRSSFFLQKLEIKIPDEKQYKFVYLSETASRKGMCLVNLDQALGRSCGFTVALDLGETDFVRGVGEAEKITDEKARELLKAKKVFGIFSERSNGLEREVY